jgi:two-component system, OmpR family, sensor histidine kinase KdpD
VDEARPNPDALLASIQSEEARLKRGRLKIFFGMAPGVGKTYAMLQAAQREQNQGVDVVVGLIETHGRAETADMLEGIPEAPRRKIDYRGTTLEEMDLDGIVFLRPQLVVVDELAHTNAPGSRHPKRYQDVLELLSLGINVFSTLNVQHVESRANSVRQITGVSVNETVPDSILEQADDIELVDISPQRLRERLAEGKVYLGARAAVASDNFFKEENLIALREIALRLTAERVDQQLRSLRKNQLAGTSGRLMVAMGPSPYSLELIRRTRRLAYAQNANWLAVAIEPETPFAPEDQRQFDKNLALARELGAEVIFTRDHDLARALLRVARENHVTQIVLGGSQDSRWKHFYNGGSLLDRLMREGDAIDLHVIPPAGKTRWKPREVDTTVNWNGYSWAAAGVGGVTLLNYALTGVTGYWSLALFYLLGILLMSLRLRHGPLLLAAALSALAWDYLFIPPLYTFYIAKFEDGFMVCLFFVVALVTGQLTSRLRMDERNERRREQKASALYRLARSIGSAGSLNEALTQASKQIRGTFEVECAFYIASSEFGLPAAPHSSAIWKLGEKEHSVAVWAYRNRRTAGRFTDTLASSQCFHIPLLTATGAYGVLVIDPKVPVLSLDERDLLESFGQQIAIFLEKESLRAEAETARVLSKSDELHRALFNSVSHELQTPLAVLQGGLDELRSESGRVGKIVETMNDAMERLKRLVKNLLDSARLETGRLDLHREWGEVRDLIDLAVELTGDSLREAKLRVELPNELPLVRIDFGLLAQALANILHNAVAHSPSPVEITVKAEKVDSSLAIQIEDNGPGISPDLLQGVFERFVRSPNAKPGGSGLGLPIAKGFIEAHGGTVEARNLPNRGSVFIVRLPLEKTPASITLET